MIWNSIPNEERLFLWKKLRNDITELNTQGQLTKIAEFCFSMPIGSRSLDYFSSENWPTPWEILFHGSFCTSSISLFMFHTVALTSDVNMELLLVEDGDGEFLLPFIDNQFILNYHLGQVSNYPDIQNEITILKRYSKEQIKAIT
jgi:hypothetical protein